MSQPEAHWAAVMRKFKQWQWVETLVGCVWWEYILDYCFKKKYSKTRKYIQHFVRVAGVYFSLLQSQQIRTCRRTDYRLVVYSAVRGSAGQCWAVQCGVVLLITVQSRAVLKLL